VAEPIRFYFDQHVQAAVAGGLRQHGVDVLTAQKAGKCGTTDPEQLQFATDDQRVLVSFDSDYLTLAATGLRHAGIAWCLATKYSIGQLIRALLLVHGVLSRAEMVDHVEYL
jgi:predicted nuclease of predicted toxin-antitoxin system